ncbi:MAG: hypothetical protein KDB14_31325 [Planctomycetales bacterium]|nr:hypothetical protein [Planctomycetales bacterium]
MTPPAWRMSAHFRALAEREWSNSRSRIMWDEIEQARDGDSSFDGDFSADVDIQTTRLAARLLTGWWIHLSAAELGVDLDEFLLANAYAIQLRYAWLNHGEIGLNPYLALQDHPLIGGRLRDVCDTNSHPLLPAGQHAASFRAQMRMVIRWENPGDTKRARWIPPWESYRLLCCIHEQSTACPEELERILSGSRRNLRANRLRAGVIAQTMVEWGRVFRIVAHMNGLA